MYRLLKNIHSSEAIRFIFVGGIGFLINFGVLFLMYDIFGTSILIAQILGAETALLGTFFGNNYWAFKKHNSSFLKKIVRYHLSAITGLIINSCIVIGLVKFADFYYGVALVLGSIAGLVSNYTLYKYFVFTHKD